MKTTTQIFQTRLDLCRFCYQCVRQCPAKAVKLRRDLLQIDDQRCVLCGACVNICKSGAIALGDDREPALEQLLESGPVVAVLSAAAEEHFSAVKPAQLEEALRRAGFYAVERTRIGEELLRRAYAELSADDKSGPLIRSTCPSTVTFIEKYRPDLVGYLAPLVGPLEAQARLIKQLYPEAPAIVGVGACLAAKIGTKTDSETALDLFLTPAELSAFLSARKIDPTAIETAEESPRLPDRLFLPARGRAGRYDLRMVDLPDTASNRGDLSESTIGSGACRACRERGPDTDIGRVDRGGGVYQSEQSFLGNPYRAMASELLKDMPKVDLGRDFQSRPVEQSEISDERLKETLAAVGLADEVARLNCGACGYDTCLEHAKAVLDGFSDWDACFPYQRYLFEQTTSQLKEASNTDSLTGLANYRGFVELLSLEFNRHKRYNSPLSLLMIDVDKFKQINDFHGHLQGDKVLRLIAQVIEKNLRDIDIAARYGGDEFAVILPETDLAQALAVAEKLRQKVASLVFWLGHEIKERVSLSIGVCGLTEGDKEPMAALGRADKALYNAKKAGRDSSVVAE